MAATNYTGNPAGTQAPGPTPAPGALPIISIPAGTDVRTIESITQSMKESADFIAYLMQRPAAINCDGFDGAIVLDGVVAAPTGMTKVGTVYTMTRDIFPSTLTVTGAGVVLYTANFRIIGSGDIITAAAGSISNDGPTGAAASTTTTTATAAGSLGAGGNGGGGGASGGANAGAAGGAIASNGLGGAGATGGTGGGIGAGGAGGGLVTPSNLNYHAWPGPNSSGYIFSTANPGVWNQLQGGSGGGGGGGSVTNVGGAGGAGGGVMVIVARRFVLANATDIHCKGGAGGAVSTGGGGGSGGGGGLMILVYGTSNQTFTAANCVTGGAAGAGGAGFPGNAGANGTLLQFNQG